MNDFNTKDCWNTIGIWGDEMPRCPELDTLIHCYNCTVYSNAGRMLLDRPLDKEYINEWTDNLSQPRAVIKKDSRSALAFRLGNEWFALPSRIVQEITQCDKHHSLPHRKNKILRGLVNVRGELLLCISLGYLFNLNKKEISVEGNLPVHERYIVISDNGKLYAFPVSEVKNIIKYNDEDLQKTPSTINNDSSNYIDSIITYQDIHMGLLDVNLIFDSLSKNIS